MKYTPEMSDYFFEALDAIVYLADNAGQNVDDAIDLEGLQDKLTALASGGVDAARACANGETEPEPEAPSAGEPAAEAKGASDEPAIAPKPKRARKSAKLSADAEDEEDAEDDHDLHQDDDGAARTAVSGQPLRVQRDDQLTAKV
jgi:hypothetical protein